MNRIQFVTLLLAGASSLAFPGLAAAQTAPPPPTPAPAAPSSSEIVVTGSRVIRNGNNSPTPVTVVPIDQAMNLQPTTVADALNNMPQFSGSHTQTSNPETGTTIQTGGGNSAGNYLDLRNMGAQRTLILFDGQRVAPTSSNGIVDVDMIPQSLLQRVDVVTGGASAVYGSDAVAGVVNFITDKNFNGLKFNAQTGETQDGDDRSYKVGFAGGTKLFDGRGHVEFSYDYYDDDGIPYRSGGARDAGQQIWSLQGAGTNAAPYFMTPYARVPSSTFGGLIVSGALNNQTFQQNGVLSPFVPGTPTIPGSTTANQIGGDGVDYNSALKASQLQHQFFGRFDYDITNHIHGFVDVSYDSKVNTTYVYWQALSKSTISSTDAFLPAAYQNELLAAGQSTFTFSKQMMDAPRTEPTTNEDQVFVNAGLSGDFGKDYNWSVGYVHSSASMTQTITNNINDGRMDAALDAVVNPATGQIVCHVTLTNPSSPYASGCIPLNPFGPTSDSAAAMKWIDQSTAYTGDTTVDDVTGSVSGAPFSSWAGPVNLALSGEWRRTAYTGVSTEPTSATVDCAGLSYNCTATQALWSQATASRSLVSETVSELAIETDLPLAKDLPFMQSLDLNGAARYTDYSISGDYATWKIGVDWHVNDDVRLRGTRSHDIRAPTLDDLYQPETKTVSTGNTTDYLTGNIVTGVTMINEGNPNLTAEQGDTWTGGIVYQPHWFPGFSVSVDYYNSTVSNAILPILSGNVVAEDACNASGGTSLYCLAFTRPLPYSNTTAANNITTEYGVSINLSEQFTQGIDFETNYATRVMDRPTTFRWLVDYQPQILYIQPGTVTLNQAGAAFGNNAVTSAPTVRFNALIHVAVTDNFLVDTETLWRDGLRPSGDPALVFANGKVPPVSYTNVTLTYQMKTRFGQTQWYANIENIFGTTAPNVSPYTNLSPGEQYNFPAFDIEGAIGREFNIGVRLRY